MRDYKKALECFDYVIDFVKSIDNPSRGASYIMIDRQGETIMETDLGYWYDGNDQLREYLRKKSEAENEIKAIPIEWIWKWYDEETHRLGDGWTHVEHPYSMKRMIEDWEKENQSLE